MIGAGMRCLTLAAVLLVVACSAPDRVAGSATDAPGAVNADASSAMSSPDSERAVQSSAAKRASDNQSMPAGKGAALQSVPLQPAVPPPTPADARSLAEATAAAEPMPARRATPEAPSAPAGKPERLDDRCNSDADCTVKDVGSCCGYRPACLNRDSPTFADAVKARCKAEGLSGVCGSIAVPGCQCSNGRCGTRTVDNGVLVQ